MAGISDRSLRNHLYVSIMCGGTGTRLWPRSRKATPKQYVVLFGDTSGLQKTIGRVKKLVTPDRLFFVTNFKQVGQVLSQDNDLHLRNIIAEPQKKNTALATAVTAAQIMKRDPEAVIVNLPADHLVTPDTAFLADLKVAARVAVETGKIAIIGIKPTFPHTGLGHINFGEKVYSVDGRAICRVIRFTEKPDLATAKKFMASGKYYWNTGLYIWKARVLMDELSKYAPKLFRLVSEYAPTIGTSREVVAMRRMYEAAEDISIDYALAEKSKNLVILPASFEWDDVGDWKIVYQQSPKDTTGTAVLSSGRGGELVQVESKNNLVQTSDRMVALVGVEKMAVIDMADVVLVCPIDRAQEVKKMVDHLKEINKKEYL